MTLTELRYITAVAKHRHFGRAAEACFVSQPTLSVAVKKLEQELGVILFERNRGDVLITPLGERIVDQARQTLAAAEQIRAIASAGQNQLDTPLNLGAIYTIGPYLVPRLLPGLHAEAAHMQLFIREGYTSDLLAALHDGELDVVLLSPPVDTTGLAMEALYREPFVVAMPAAHPWTARERIRAGDLAEETLLLLGAGNCFRDQVLNVCPACRGGDSLDNELQRTLEGGSLETIRQMVASGAGITVLPGTSVSGATDMDGMLALRPFDNPVPSRDVAMVWRAGYPRTEAIAAVRRAILKAGIDGVTPHPPPAT